MGKHPAIFLDRDGTIIKDVGDIGKTSLVEFYPYTFNALQNLQEYYILFIITNQSGIGKGLITEDKVKTVNKFIVEKLELNKISILDTFCCPHKTEDKCECKKPNPYFIKQAEEKYNLDLSSSYIIGDHPSDVECGINAGIEPIYLLSGHGGKHIKEMKFEAKICKNVMEASKYILSTINI